MENTLQIFENKEFGKVRSVLVKNEPYFVGKDVAEILAYKDTADAIKKHVDDEDKVHVKVGEIPTLKTSNYGAYLINESGLYSLILSSKLPTAKKFKHWVTSDVLPRIRKNKFYILNQENLSEKEENDMISKAMAILAKRNDELTAALEDKSKEVEELTPDAESWRKFAESDGNFCVTKVASMLGLNRDVVFGYLHAKGYICRDKSTGKWIGTIKGTSERGYVVNKLHQTDTFTAIRMLLTPKGMQKVQDAFSVEKAADSYLEHNGFKKSAKKEEKPTCNCKAE